MTTLKATHWAAAGHAAGTATGRHTCGVMRAARHSSQAPKIPQNLGGAQTAVDR